MKFYNTLRSFHSLTQPKGRLKATFDCSKSFREQFASSTAQMTISVGQSVHEGERLESITQLINRSFTHCKVVIDDSIQSYTLGIGEDKKSKKELLKTAIAAGDSYLRRNQKIFENNFTIPYEIIRWRDWLHTPAWERAIQDMRIAYQNHELFRQAIDKSVQRFLDRYQRNYPCQNYDHANAQYLCTEYLLEECGVMKDIWVQLGCHFEVYPSKRNDAMTATYMHFIEPINSHLLRPVAVRFNRRSLIVNLLEEGIDNETKKNVSLIRSP